MTKHPNEYDEEALGRLLSALPPPPPGWVEAAAEIPQTRRDAERIVALAEADREFREALIADLEQAIEQRGFEPSERLLAEVRVQLERR